MTRNTQSLSLVVATLMLLPLLLLCNVICEAAVTTTVPPADRACSGNVFKRVQTCLKETGVISAALQSVVNPKFVPQFCGLSTNETLDCLQDQLHLCADDPFRLALLKLQVAPLRSHGNLRYFCKNRHVLRGEGNCTRFHEVRTCTERAAGKLKDALLLTTEFKPVLDTQCLYNDDILQCLTGTMGDNCNGTRQLYVHLTSAMRFPYCDLDPLQQHVQLHKALTVGHSDPHTGSAPLGSTGGSAGHSKGDTTSVHTSGAWTTLLLVQILSLLLSLS